MADNKDLKSIGDLLGMKFFIPSYQRGFRWTNQQVWDLLNDINEFKPEKENTNEETWYCLQPLVVRHMDEGDSRLSPMEDKHDWYEVIDGQQRLTTISLLVHYFNEKWIGEDKKQLPIIKYETRNDSYDYMISLKIDETGSAKSSIKDGSDYIDFYYMEQAYNEIHKWAKAKKEGNSFDNNAFQSKSLWKTKFIWYESVDEDPVKVFTRLNIGKISLTNAELIKALFLNRSNFRGNDAGHLKLRQQEIASEWDNIEFTLQNDEFWLFLHEKGYDRPTRIDFIFDIIYETESKSKEIPDKQIKIGNDNYKTFRYFYEYFRKDSIDDEFKIKECWEKVKSYFQTFQEWFGDLELYHYVGFLIEIKKGKTLQELIKKWNKVSDKKDFVSYLKEEINEIIDGCPKVDSQYKEDGGDKQKCKPILLFHNIQTIINQNSNFISNEKYQIGVFYKFPFHLYKLEGWDVEHINSNITNAEDDDATQSEWLLNIYLGVDERIQKEIHRYFNSSDNDRKAIFEEIKTKTPQNEEWTSEDKNRIWNYALLDSSTNKSYGNAIFSGKRRVIIGKDKGKNIAIPKISDGKIQLGKETDASSSFVPPCTKHIFMKYYSPSMSESNYWTKIDAIGYKNDIESCLEKIRIKQQKNVENDEQ